MKMYRMPTCFGNSPGPRSDLAGNRHDWSAARRRVLRWQSAVDAGQLRQLLPAGCDLDGPARVQFEFQQLENLPWLAGRGYSLFCVKAPVRLRRATGEDRVFSFLLVMWENLADPIITGREELGFAKLFADLHWDWNESTLGGVRASWDGHEFFGLKAQTSTSAAADAGAFPPDLLHHRYVPAVGRWGEAALEQLVCSPAGASAAPVSQLDCAVTFSFNSGTWEDLPTLWHIVSRLEALQPARTARGQLSNFLGGADHFGQAVLT